MTVGAFLDGNDSDLKALAELTTGGEHYVEQTIIDGELRWVLRGPRIEYLWHDPGEMNREAGRLVIRLNGLPHAERRNFHNVRNLGRYSGPGNTASVTSVACAIEIDTAFGVGPAAPPLPQPGPAYFAALDRNPVVGQVLDLMGRDDELSSYSMCKVLRADPSRRHRHGEPRESLAPSSSVEAGSPMMSTRIPVACSMTRIAAETRHGMLLTRRLRGR